MSLTGDQLDARYARLAGVVSGYLPQDRAAVDEWNAQVLGELRAAPQPQSGARQ